jgi:hypothetical protein
MIGFDRVKDAVTVPQAPAFPDSSSACTYLIDEPSP